MERYLPMYDLSGFCPVSLQSGRLIRHSHANVYRHSGAFVHPNKYVDACSHFHHFVIRTINISGLNSYTF